jgi:hypothetical protein
LIARCIISELEGTKKGRLSNLVRADETDHTRVEANLGYLSPAETTKAVDV